MIPAIPAIPASSATTPADLVFQIARFGRALRERGAAIHLSDEADGLAVLTLVDLADRDEVRRALRAGRPGGLRGSLRPAVESPRRAGGSLRFRQSADPGAASAGRSPAAVLAGATTPGAGR
jgi:hypothetical protein